ncbi:LacI family DNA-binding transcriptional regulator [Sporosarcina sp. 6E9]|uniref:LacI family DNA-binding transcriptional regulator n=1 Tax=Sporosarcina sp. 6E9 TaxID=2819235 RepID=UPI001B30AB00|nr:LacI family DNA-binding transcriptional regulator [Sporosarcina sp. 6E9]
MKVTIMDVANHANVSKATVSRVINDNPKVANEIRQRVLLSIKELGYRPNAFARNLANNSSNVIGLILPDITNPYFPVIARGIEDAAHQEGFSLFISNTDNSSSIEQEYIQKMVGQQVGGIILIASILDEDKVNELDKLNIPFVLCDRFLTNTPFDTVSIDHYKASYEAVLHLIEKGHRKICHLSGPGLVQSAEMRRQAYSDAMQAHNLEPCIRIGDFSYASGYQLMTSILKESMPTAVFAANDLIALGAMNAIQEQNLKIPQDISVIGCDDILFAQMSTPKLSTISVPAYQIGVTAVDMLVERILGDRSVAKNLIMAHEFIQRES